MKKLFFIAIPLLLFSCTPKWIGFKGKYADLPIKLTSSNNFNTVWDKVIDLFAQKGLPIKLIDRSSGLIICDKSVLKTTVEDKNGIIEDKEAWIVVPKRHDPGLNRDVAISGSASGAYSKKMIPNDVIGEWNIRVKETNGITTINVNIVNVRIEDINGQGYIKELPLVLYKSTGVFENIIFDAVK